MSRIYPIGGGKGGSGKSFVAANLGVLLAKSGKRVALVDLDLGGANLHTFLGLKNPSIGLNEFLNKTCTDLNAASVPTSINNLYLISSSNCPPEVSNLFYAQKLKIIRAIGKLPYEYILLDLGAGCSFNILDFFLTSKEGIFIFTPEPTSIENTFHFIKAVYSRKMNRIIKGEDFQKILQDIRSQSPDVVIRSPQQLFDLILSHDQEKGDVLKEYLNQFDFKLILNQFRKHTDGTIGKKIEKVCTRHFFSNFEFLGNIHYDERVHDAVSSRKVYMTKYAYSVTALDLQNIAERIIKDSTVPKVRSLGNQ
ncbi:MAG: P-loop NTPase [Deltaproteobacteria bacterium]|nr:P-loop NTPase [Deltaproteobacteria bacterium]MBW2136560.1 P-loop NTPase [Deltaproteobacteria bacterium]